MTHYVQIEHDQQKFDPANWFPWRNCKNVQETAMLAAHKFMREAGYASGRSEFEPFEITVYVAEDTPDNRRERLPAKDQKCVAGPFLTCHGFKMKMSKK